jgi:hypothetical protein
MPNTMSLLNRLLPDTRSCDIVIRVVVLLLDQIDVMNMHTVARNVRDVVRAFRVSCASRFYSLRHHNGLLRRHGRMFGARALLCLLDAVIMLYKSAPEEDSDPSACGLIQ